MAAAVAMFGLGPMEVLILGVICLLPTAGAIIAVVVLLARRASTSNLIPCPDCGRPLSPQAPSCPHCGRPLG